jgi:chemotaxis protein histidine kinase CheA
MSTGDDDEGTAAYIAMFIDLGEKRIERALRALEVLRADPGDEQAKTDLARELHTLKGEAALVDLPEISRAARDVESRLQARGAAEIDEGLRRLADMVLALKVR